MKSPQKRVPDRKTAQPSRTKQAALQTGHLAETFVAHWLTLQGWTVLYQRWHCPYGELDVVATLFDAVTSDAVTSDALTPDALIFVEVKARSKGNWDENGLLSITPQKQAKLWQAAELFLAEHPHLADLPCRFDVALLSCKPVRSARQSTHSQTSLPLAIASRFPQGVIELGQPVVFQGYELTLQQYIVNAFSEI